ncbi:cysteine synthase family protein [Paenibacillus alvei]|uniref:Cysteine synthase family protein n=1 Tax=Paenibacillus alvei TaxID=44250 RepID=A0ABT4GVV5_PAEAL|nr:cysteine synthase family protein [Paenibacillus alvei]EJW15274.1 pyridoxal-phosphate dependent enzyme [Paenibacillus alvei DSM 29]MCY9544165.1 cysteine synthase family protein [Paenibacillus alvei]MCY9702924.1 cysteine synthase family protein [Paenibacillus alvei]MCY9733239.1 cysteine synthase family protein [Paenibacillus alvei]MCY9754106.1 cysteine synthase family protein [Paenibacillus alvei]
MLHESMVDAVGRVPLVKLRLDEQCRGNVYAKLELMNPFGMKDRVAKQIILEAKKAGQLKDGAPIVESSSGTMACGIALVGTHLGHPVHIVTDPRIDPITMAKLTSLGCRVYIVDKMNENGWQGARLEKLQELLNQYPDAYWPRQYDNPDNPRAYKELAEELVADLGHVDILVASVGSGGSMSGTAAELRRHNPNMRVVAVDATGSVIFGQPDRKDRLQSGLGNSLVAANVNHSIVDEVHWLNDEESFAATLQLAEREKIFAGNSSGSVYAVARWISTRVNPETKIVALFPDRGDRYVDTIYSERYRLEKGIHQLRLPDEPLQVSEQCVVHSWSYTQSKGAYAGVR